MADLIPPMLIQLQADVTQLKTGLAQAENALKGVDDSVKTASTGMTNFMGKMKQVGATIGVAFAGQQIVQFGKDVIMASSNMAESMSKVDVVFGQNAQTVKSWSETSAQAMGMSQQAALEAAGTYGNLFQAFGLGQGPAQEMSTTLVQLASDMASFNNTSIDDAILALRSGLSGETEPLKKFGVALSDARLKDEALAMGLIKSTKEAWTPAAKAQASYSLIMKDTILAQGDYSRTADGTANTMRTLKAEFDNAKVALGDALMPAFQAILAVLKLLVPVLTAIGKFFKENSDAIKMYATLVGLLTAAFYTYKAALILVKATQQAWVVMQTIMKGATLASIASTNGLAASMLALNAAIKANPIGLIVTALLLVGAAFIAAWKKSETFRGVVIKVIQVVMNGFAMLISIAAKFFNLLGKVPGMGWAKSVGKGLDGISDKIKTTSKNLSDLKSGFKGMGNISMTTGTTGASTSTTTTTTTTTTDTATAKALAAAKEKAAKIKETLKGYQKDVTDIYADINTAIADAQERADEALVSRNEDMLEAHKNYDERVADLNKNFAEANAEADKQFAEAKADAEKRRAKAESEAYKRHKAALDNINKDYAKKTAELEKNLNAKLDDIRKKAADKSAELTKSAADKQAAIVQQSVDRLRNAFSKVSEGFDVGKLFEKGMSAEGLLAKLQNNLMAAKNLAEKAAFLQANGFSQTFIEQVMAAGPEAGNALADSILNSSPETIKQLQATFNEAEKTANHGVDGIAQSMNSGGKLATEELMNSFNQVSVDLKESLAAVNTEMELALAEAQTAYEAAMVEAKAARDEKIAEANDALLEALADAKEAYDEAMADAQKALEEARAKAKKDLDEGLADATKTLQDALLKAQKDYENALDEINKSTDKKLKALKDRLAEIAAEMAKLGTAEASKAAVAAIANAPGYNPIIPQGLPGNGNGQTGLPGNGNTTIVNQTFNNAVVDPGQVQDATLSGIKYGNAVTIPNAGLRGVANKLNAQGID